ncbi:hypothetical protein RclHR1_00330012 [Rhizophagus clarus]|uniref:BTB domain-containing protein n=1 Tax=Rhizophagus clarus TaxID=94130 RepID=A0A2Z6R8V3_9GLOM|nr:hypothetical protein RclHR1_00330012 [Rhizophagus clarus]GES81746.1 hypothetical protein GLOIN_2v1778254 [Rhizophagus clarus]
MTSIFHSGLSKDFSSILNDADDFNVIIQVGENNDVKEFRAHSVVLRARSAYFKGALSNEWVTKKDGIILYNKPNITPTIFDLVLKYIYTGELDLEKFRSKDVLELLVASDELVLDELLEHVQDYLIKKRTTWVKEKNSVLVLDTAFRLMSCKRLQDFCLNLICINPQPFITSDIFLSLDKDILYSLLEREDLQIDENVVWEYLIKWGIEQTPCLISTDSSDITKWNNENYEELKKTLDKFIPLIRFVEISPTVYHDKVKPYKHIIPNNIIKEIEEFYSKGTLQNATILLPRARKTQFKSKIIKKNLIPTIINWINKRDAKIIPDKNDLSYKFGLIYRGSKDEINNNSFQKKCHMKEPILVLIKCKNSRRIFGGYTSTGFHRVFDDFERHSYRIRNNHSSTLSNGNFIFTFEKNDDTQNMSLSRVKSHCNIFNNYHGFNFGKSILYMQHNTLYVNYDFHYDHKKRCSGKYIIEEIEAFRVVKMK